MPDHMAEQIAEVAGDYNFDGEANDRLIERSIVESRQSVKLISYHKVNDKKVKVEIDRDAYDFQSHARSYFFTDRGWEFVYSIPYQEMNAVLNKFTVYDRELNNLKKSLLLDEKRILTLTKEILE